MPTQHLHLDISPTFSNQNEIAYRKLSIIICYLDQSFSNAPSRPEVAYTIDILKDLDFF